MTWKHFTLEEFGCKCGCELNAINEGFIDRLDALRDEYAGPIIVTSGYRCPAHNKEVSHTGAHGPHTTGCAADIRIDRQNAYRLLRLAMQHGFTGIGVKQKGRGRFLHLDDLTNAEGQLRPTIWSY